MKPQEQLDTLVTHKIDEIFAELSAQAMTYFPYGINPSSIRCSLVIGQKSNIDFITGEQIPSAISGDLY